MAKQTVNVASVAQQIISEVRSGVFKPVYVLMGPEPFYPDMICDAILDNCLDESEKDFNQSIFYGPDSDAEKVISAARRYPMMAERQLVVLKEAQLMKDLESLSLYCENPLDTTVLVVLLRGASLDKRKSFYKSAQKAGVVVESPEVKEYEIVQWIMSYYSSRGLDIAPEAAQLLAEYAGTDLCTISIQTDKLLKNLKEGQKRVSVEDIEANVGMSRQFGIFELTRELSFRNRERAVRIASHMGNSARFQLPAAVSAMFTHFYRILKYGAFLNTHPGASTQDRAEFLKVSAFFLKEYDSAVRNYPVKKIMAVISMLNEYDFKGKGGEVGPETSAGDLLVELTTKILNI